MPRLHAHFESMYEARKALNAMKEAGHTRVCLDMSGAYDYEYSSEITGNTGDTSCLSPLVTRAGGCLLNPRSSPLVAAGTAVSGPAHSDDSRSICVKLVASVDDVNKEAAAGIIKENGGRIFPTFIE